MTDGILFDVVQTGQQANVVVFVDGRQLTTFEMFMSDFERFIESFDKKPVVTVTHGEPTKELDYTDQRNLG